MKTRLIVLAAVFFLLFAFLFFYGNAAKAEAQTFTEYRIIQAFGLNDIQNYVTRYLNEGWRLYGNPWSDSSSGGTASMIRYYQAMVK